MSLDKLGKVLGGQEEKTETLERSLTGRDSSSNWFLIPETKLKIRVTKTSYNTQDVSGTTLIWNHNTYGEWDAFSWGGDFEKSYGTATSLADDALITITGRNEIRNFLGAVGTARPPTHIYFSSGTTPYYQTSTAIPAGLIGTALIGTATRTNNSLTLEAQAYSVDAGTGTMRSFGLVTTDGETMYHYNIPTDSLAIDDSNNYKFTYTMTFEDDSINNTWTNNGTAWVADWVGGTSNAEPTHIGFGTGTASADPTSTTLNGEFLRKEIDGYSNTLDKINRWNTVLLANEGVGTTLTRSGIFTGGTASPNAKLLIENKHFDVAKTALFIIDVDHKNELN